MYQLSMKKDNLLGWDETRLTELARNLGEPAFRGRQLFHQIYQKRQYQFPQMTDLPKQFRDQLCENCEVEPPRIHQRSDSQDGTVKLLLELEDGKHIETVYIPEERRDTLCVSSQVGCDVGCTFCLTARMGFQRNLRPGEIVGQVLVALGLGMLRNGRFNIVLMGMGEPLYNYANVMRAFHLLIHPSGLNLSYRRITLSTSGVVPVLEKMREEPILPNLAISLNATTEELRNEIMPINQKWNLQELLEVCRTFPLDPRRRITFEYVMIRGVNDSDEDALGLVQQLKGIRAKVNLIPFNPDPLLPYQRPSDEQVQRFRQLLVDRNVSAFVRTPRGDDISAACGQLAYMGDRA